MKKVKDKILPSVKPNAGIRVAYRKKLKSLVDEMHNSVLYWIGACYKQNEPLIAQDARTPADRLNEALRRLRGQWTQRFDKASLDLATYFGKNINKRSEAQLKAILKRSGMTVDFKLTRQQRDVLKAVIEENVSLIKSIPEQYFKSVEGAVMRSVSLGRDLEQLTKDIKKAYAVSDRRATIIARDQTNKATSALTRSRQMELGIKKAQWQHSSAGKTPRPTHVRNDGKTYDIEKGWYDPAVKKYIHPGELINCRCTARSIIPGFI